jgi:hypothetical protein
MVVLKIHVTINALVFTQLKICLQFDFIWWDSLPGSASTSILSAAVARRIWGKIPYNVLCSTIHSYAANMDICVITRLSFLAFFSSVFKT